jgi:single-stranded-DNA-specific exonuclease
LTSAGLALKLAQALLGPADAPSRVAPYLDLAALGTLADYAPLVGDNRIIVAAGLSRIVRSDRPGLAKLCEATDTGSPEPEHVIRRLVPRLNASGRLGDALAIWRLLLREQDGRLDGWAAAAAEAHLTAKRLQRQVIAEAEDAIRRLHFRDQYVIVVSRRGWPQGLMGPLASQLAKRYDRPAIALALNGNEGTGSGRSIPRFNLFEALRACREALVRFGGHAQACGLTVACRHLERFRTLVNAHARLTLGRHGLLGSRMADLESRLQGVAEGWVRELERLTPFGPGNPRPTVIIRRVAIRPMSARTGHCHDGPVRVNARGLFSAERLNLDGALGSAGQRYDVLATPAMESDQLVLTVTDVRPSAAP